MSLPPTAGPPPPWGGPGLPDDPFPDREEPTDAVLFGLWPDPFAGPPDGEDAWLGVLSLPELDALAGQWESQHGPPVDDVLGAGFGRDLPGDPALGFAAGGPLDGLDPGPVLAGFTGEAFDAGLGSLSDDELVGVLCAARRLQSWQAALEFTAIAELDNRRRAQAKHPESSRVHDHINAELAAALIMTGKTADGLLDLSRGLARLPDVLAALAQGRIDRDRAQVFAAELAALDAKAARAVALALLGRAGKLTTGQLRWALRAMVLTLNPDAAKERAERGRRQARVELWPESSGNTGIAGRELPQAEATAADARITAIAQALKDAGAPGGMDQLRAAVFTALLTGRDPNTLLPARAAGTDVSTVIGTVHLTMPAATWLGRADTPGQAAGVGPIDAATTRDLAQRLAAIPGCIRPAQRCDADHTIPYDQGGTTCECNMSALCRQHHKTKQAQDWHLEQPTPGTLTWTTPHGHSYTVTPDSYLVGPVGN